MALFHLSLSKTLRALAVVLAGAAGAHGVVTLASWEGAQVTRSSPAQITQMRHHFLQVTLIHEAIIRGDSGGCRRPGHRAGWCGGAGGHPWRVLPFIPTLRMAGRRAAEARNLATAASAAASMLAQCGGCHRAAMVRPGAIGSRSSDVGGIVGHMLEHQRALDELAFGAADAVRQRVESGRGASAGGRPQVGRPATGFEAHGEHQSGRNAGPPACRARRSGRDHRDALRCIRVDPGDVRRLSWPASHCLGTAIPQVRFPVEHGQGRRRDEEHEKKNWPAIIRNRPLPRNHASANFIRVFARMPTAMACAATVIDAL